MMKIVLASASKNRQEIFNLVGIKVETVSPQVDEKNIREKDFSQRALAIAKLKADWVKSQLVVNQNSIIIAGDGFNICQEEIIEKPSDLRQARMMLKQLSGHSTIFYSACVMLNLKTNDEFSKVVSSKAWFRKLENIEIEDYIQTTPVLQYSAAYSPLNTKAISFIKKIEGSLSGFSHSMPMDLVIPQLRKWQAL